ncbi:MAG: BrnT family toxin [Chloroflexi bacterium]|nr:BrnT family toxin [Chloroflexota bacterium]
MKFDWDPAKAEKNDAKYGVSFDEAATIFKDPHALYSDDIEHSQKEKREMVIGRSAARSRLLTCFIERAEGAVRIISARVSTHRERQDYDENAETKY